MNMTVTSLKQKNMKTLESLYNISSHSGNEKKMRKYIRGWISQNVGICKMDTDEHGNLFVTKGISATYPCVVAHMDEVHLGKGKGFKVVHHGDIICGFNYDNNDYCGIGADDKNGIWVALRCLKKFSAIKCAFFVQEESGCIGSNACDIKWFSDCRFILQCDRKTGSDLITTGCGVELCTTEFLAATDYADFGYKPTTGSLSDVVTLTVNGVGISTLNIACGYYHPHEDEEFTKFTELQNCCDFVEHIIENCVGVYPHTYEAPAYKSYGYGYGYGKYGYYGDSYGGKYPKYGDYYNDEEAWYEDDARFQEMEQMREDMLEDYTCYKELDPYNFFDNYAKNYPHCEVSDFVDIASEITGD